LARVAAQQRAATARQGFNDNARQRAVCERGFMVGILLTVSGPNHTPPDVISENAQASGPQMKHIA